MHYVLGATSAVAAGASFAGAAVLQQRVAAEAEGDGLRLLAALVRRRSWVAGVGLAATAWGFQALALWAAPLALVQPLLVTELVFAIPFAARTSGHALGPREWTGLLAVCTGVAATAWGSVGTADGGVGTLGRWVSVGGGLVAVAAVLAMVGRTRGPLTRAACFATAAALVFALSAALMDATVDGFAEHGVGGLLQPAPYAMALTSFAGLLLIQSAFAAGPLVVAMPVINWVGPLVAVLLGSTVLGESLDVGPMHAAALLIGASIALGGILTLTGSPAVRAAEAQAEPQRPRQTGERFSANAVAPSRASSEANTGPAIAAWWSHPSVNVQSGAASAIRFEAATARGPLAAIR